MSFISLKLLPAARNVSPRWWKNCMYGIRRNYWRRRDSFSELSGAMQSLENYMKDIDREMNRVFGDVQRLSPVKLPRLFAPLGLESSQVRDIPVMSTDGDSRVYKLELEMEGMNPENINITLKNNELRISARRDEKRDDGSRFVRENAYHYTLPDDINPDTVRSSLSNGILTIEAQLPAVEESKEIPINIESGEKSNTSDSSDLKK